MKKCSCCGNEITTLKYYSSINNDVCLECGDIYLVEEPELYMGGYQNPHIKDEEVRDVYSDDVRQDLELFYLSQHEGQDLENLIEHLNDKVKNNNAYIRGLEKTLKRNVA